jgi:periplasmic protein TonB
MSSAPSSPATELYRAAVPRVSAGAIAAIVGAHVAVLAWLASLDVLPLPSPVTTLMVQMVPPAPPAPPETAPPTKPRPVEHKPTAQPKPRPQLPIVAAQTPGPAMAEAPVVAARAPAPITAAAAPVIEQAAQPPVTSPTQPRFDADYLQNPPPVYPAQSRRFGEEGKVVLRVFVEPGGRPTQIEVKTHSGSPRLDLAAQEAVWRWKFVPARLGGEAISAWVLVPIVFNLRG